MNLPTIACARVVRDGGIDAMAALDSAVRAALASLPAEQASELKQAFGRVMGEIVSELINPAVRAFPELALDESTWTAVARDRARQRRLPPSGEHHKGIVPANDD